MRFPRERLKERRPLVVPRKETRLLHETRCLFTAGSQDTGQEGNMGNRANSELYRTDIAWVWMVSIAIDEKTTTDKRRVPCYPALPYFCSPSSPTFPGLPHCGFFLYRFHSMRRSHVKRPFSAAGASLNCTASRSSAI